MAQYLTRRFHMILTHCGVGNNLEALYFQTCLAMKVEDAQMGLGASRVFFTSLKVFFRENCFGISLSRSTLIVMCVMPKFFG